MTFVAYLIGNTLLEGVGVALMFYFQSCVTCWTKMTQPIDPINYWIISGSKYGSRIFVFEGKGYCLDKKYAENNILGNRKTLHLRCKNRGCRARGKIVEGWFSRKAGEDHTCQTKSEKLLVEDLKTKMKKRAKTEATRLQVLNELPFISKNTHMLLNYVVRWVASYPYYFLNSN